MSTARPEHSASPAPAPVSAPLTTSTGPSVDPARRLSALVQPSLPLTTSFAAPATRDAAGPGSHPVHAMGAAPAPGPLRSTAGTVAEIPAHGDPGVVEGARALQARAMATLLNHEPPRLPHGSSMGALHGMPGATIGPPPHSTPPLIVRDLDLPRHRSAWMADLAPQGHGHGIGIGMPPMRSALVATLTSEALVLQRTPPSLRAPLDPGVLAAASAQTLEREQQQRRAMAALTHQTGAPSQVVRPP